MTAATWDDTIKRVAREIFEGKLKGPIDPEMVRAKAAELMEVVTTGMGGAEKLAALDQDLIDAITNNVYKFSGFKNYQQLREATDALKDADGNMRSFDDWFSDVKLMDNTYNKVYAASEYQTANSTADGISRWHKFERDNVEVLTWLTSGDETVCEVCGSYNGFTARRDDPAWSVIWYPAHFRCKCIVRAALDSEPISEEVPAPDIPKGWEMFRHNAGKDGVVFSEKMPYFVAASKKIAKAITQQSLALIPDKPAPSDAVKRVFEHKESGGFVDVHPDADKTDLKDNIAYGKVFARLGYEVTILEHSTEPGVKNPEVSIDGRVGDFKHPQKDTHGSLQGQIESAAKQGAEFAAIFLKGRKYTIQDQVRAINGALGKKDYNKSIKFIYLVYPDDDVVKIERKEIKGFKFVTKLKPL